jgi:hypothetical protein
MFDSGTSALGYRGAILCSEMVIRWTVNGELQLKWKELTMVYFKVQLQPLLRGSMKTATISVIEVISGLRIEQDTSESEPCVVNP